MKWLECLILLCYPAIDDIRSRKFNMIPIIGLEVMLLVLNALLGINGIGQIVCGCIPGGILFAVSVWTKEAIGKGDALLTICIGSIIGWQQVIEMLMISLILCSIVGLFLVVLQQAGKKTVMPFVPFLLVTVIVMGLV